MALPEAEYDPGRVLSEEEETGPIPWLQLIDKWYYILYQRDRIFPKYDLSGKVLEIGCGRRAWFSLMVKEYFGNEAFVVTTDVLLEKVRNAKEIAASLGSESDGYVVADAAHLPFRRGVFQKTIGNAVLHHLMPNIGLVAREIHDVSENSSDGDLIALFPGEIVASRYVGWFWKKISLEKKGADEGIATVGVWRKQFLDAGFSEARILREHRFGYNQSILRNVYYGLLKYLPESFVIRFGLTSVTIIAFS